MTGRLPIYRLLLAQAYFETGGYTSHGFKVRKNGFGMRPSVPNAGNPQAVRTRPKWWTTEDNGFAAYPSYYAGCRDRIDLDQSNDISPMNPRPSDMTLEQWYMESVMDEGYVPAADRQGYIVQWRKALDNPKAMEGAQLPSIITGILTVGVTITVLYMLWKAWRKRKRAQRPARKWWSKLRRSRKAKA